MFGYRTRKKNKLKAEIIKDLLKDDSLKDIVNNIDIYIDARMRHILLKQETIFAAKMKALKFETIKSFNQADKLFAIDKKEIISVVQNMQKNLMQEINADRRIRAKRETNTPKGREY